MALWSLAARAGIPAARAGLRFLSKLRKPPKGITVYRGEPKSTDSIKDVAKWMYAGKDKYRNPLRQSAAGRWFTREPKFASRFAGYTGPFGSSFAVGYRSRSRSVFSMATIMTSGAAF